MKWILSLKTGRAFAVYILFDIICVGIGMGVPIFCIFLGFPVGWYITLRMIKSDMAIHAIMRKVLLYSIVTSGITFLIMTGIWGWCIKMLFDANARLEDFGLPMILYEPTASFIGWLVLMIIISPCLQLLATTFGSYLTIMLRMPRHRDEEQ